MITMIGLGIRPTERIKAINRTGGALSVGGVYALDVSRVQAESTSADTSLSNLTPIAAANIGGILVVAEAATADNYECWVTVAGFMQVLVDGTVDVAAGDLLAPQVGSVNLIKLAGQYKSCAIALGAQTTNSGTLTDVYFNGWNMGQKANNILLSDTSGSTLVENIAAETQFDKTVVIPANSLKVGDKIHIHGYTMSPTATNSTDTLQIKVIMGPAADTLVASGTDIAVSSAIDMAANGAFVFDIWLTVKTIGASGTCKGHGMILGGASGAIAVANAIAVPTTHTTDLAIKTDAAIYIGGSLITSTQNAANEAHLEEISVEVIRA